MRHKRLATLATLTVLSVFGFRGAAFGQFSICHGFVALQYVSAPAFAGPGDIARVRVTLTSGVITGVDPMITVNRLRFDLDCNVDQVLGPGCTDDGDVVAFAGNITTTCVDPSTQELIAWTATPNPTNSNQIVFTPSPPLSQHANDTVGCQLEFDVRALGPSHDSTPSRAEEVAGYVVSTQDAQCNNGLSSSGSQAAAFPLCQPCHDDDACTTDVCPNDHGVCASDGTSCTSDVECAFAGDCNSICEFTPSADSDGDGFCDAVETAAGCNPNDGAEIPPQSPKFTGKTGAKPDDGIIVYAAPASADVAVATDPACATAGRCGTADLCTAGRIADPCVTDADCDQAASTCRLVLTYADAADLALTSAELDRAAVPGFTPATPGCSRKVDLSIPAGGMHRLTLEATATVGSRLGRDVDRFMFR